MVPRRFGQLPWPRPTYANSGWSIVLTLAAWVACLSPQSTLGAETLLASYEPAETDLTVTPGAGDTGLALSIVQGGVGGVPGATDGAYVLKVDFAGEDGKIEFRHDWSASTYDLDGEETLLADVYIATPSALPGLMGIWTPNWDPPNAWEQAAGIPATTGTWTTISFNVSTRSQTGLNQIWAFIFENMPGATGTAYVDNLRLYHADATTPLTGVAVNAYLDNNHLIWKLSTDAGLEGYNVYRAGSLTGPFTKLNSSPLATAEYIDPVGQGRPEYYYYATRVVSGAESDPSLTVRALYNGLSDDELLTLVQQATFGYFWFGAHPTSGMALEGIDTGHSPNTVTTGGTGMGLATIVVGAERGFVTRAAAASRVLQILTFLEDVAPRYHGAWSHQMHGATGATIPFAGAQDNGGDLVETAFLVEGMLIARQYFDDPADPVEIELRDRATRLWEGVEWDWYRQFPSSDVLYWHWSPDYDFAINHPIVGFNETMIVYILAVASPTYPMPASSYYNGWSASPGYTNGGSFYGFLLPVGPDFGGPMFYTHYSYFGFDPRDRSDAFANYFTNSRSISLIDQAYCADNPSGFAGYSGFTWGLTASRNPWGYSAHSPTSDNGTITPTAAISSMPYTPEQSLAATRHMFDTYFADLWGTYGFKDAFNPSQNWFDTGYLAIDQGTIAPMIENYRTGLCWRMFMKNSEIEPALKAIGWSLPGDLDTDGDVDVADYGIFAACLAGPAVSTQPGACSFSQFENADLDNDGDVDAGDYAIFQQRFDTP